MRSIWTGAIGFGLVNIPIKLYTATKESRLSFNQLDKKDEANIRYLKVNANTGKEVKADEIVKAFNYDGKYVIMNDEDFEKASSEKNNIIQIEQFANDTEVDSIYYEQPYYLEPDKSGSKPYVLLRDALKKSKKVAFGTFVLRNVESLVVLKPMEDVIVLNKIRFPEEVRDYSELKLPSNEKLSKPEMDMALSLIEQLTKKFDITAYHDTYTAELMKVIEAKAKGRKLEAKKMKVVYHEAKDLMSVLKESLAQNKKRAS